MCLKMIVSLLFNIGLTSRIHSQAQIYTESNSQFFLPFFMNSNKEIANSKIICWFN